MMKNNPDFTIKIRSTKILANVYNKQGYRLYKFYDMGGTPLGKVEDRLGSVPAITESVHDRAKERIEKAIKVLF